MRSELFFLQVRTARRRVCPVDRFQHVLLQTDQGVVHPSILQIRFVFAELPLFLVIRERRAVFEPVVYRITGSAALVGGLDALQVKLTVIGLGGKFRGGFERRAFGSGDEWKGLFAQAQKGGGS